MLKKSLLVLLLAAALRAILFSASARADRFAYVVNNYPGDEMLSKINLTTGEVVNNIEALGVAANQIVIQGDFAYVVNSLDHNIQIIDSKTETTVGYIIIGEPRNPFHMAFMDSQYAYVTNLMTNTISKVDVINRTVVGEYEVGVAPEGLLVLGNKLYVCCTGYEFAAYRRIAGRDWVFDPTHRANDVKAYRYIAGKVYVFDVQNDVVLDSIPVGLNPQYLAMDPEGELNVMCTGNYWSVFGKIYRINPTTNSVIDSIATGGSPGIISIGFDGIGYLAAGGWRPNPGLVYTFDSHADTMLRGASNPITTHSGVIAVSAFPDSKVFTCNFDADDVTLLNSSGTLLETYLVGNGPVSIGFYPPLSHQVPILDRIGAIILVVLLIPLSSLILFRKRSLTVAGEGILPDESP
jgi:DNA-binding beta-propeller fold protein YncE